MILSLVENKNSSLPKKNFSLSSQNKNSNENDEKTKIPLNIFESNDWNGNVPNFFIIKIYAGQSFQGNEQPGQKRVFKNRKHFLTQTPSAEQRIKSLLSRKKDPEIVAIFANVDWCKNKLDQKGVQRTDLCYELCEGLQQIR